MREWTPFRTCERSWTTPGGTGQHVRIGGFEEWTIDDDGLIAVSLGHFDQAEYDRQVQHGAG